MKKALLAVLILACSISLHAQQKQALTASATSCTVSSTACLVYGIDQTMGGATFTVGSNSGGNTLQFEASGDGGSTWVALNVTQSNSTTAVTSTTGTGTWQANVAGYTQVRIRCSTFVSGSAVVSILTSLASARSGGGGGGSGTVTSVSGTANQIDVATGTTTPVISVDSALQLPGTLSMAQAGASSAAAVTMSGLPFAGTGTTSTPLFYQNGGTSPTTWSTGGTYFGVNAASGFAGNLIDFHLNGGNTLMNLSSGGTLTVATAITSQG